MEEKTVVAKKPIRKAPRRKVCAFCVDKVDTIDYKDIAKLRKYSKVAIVGSLQNRTYDDKDGNRRTVTDIVASEVEFLSTGGQRENGEIAPVKKEQLQLEEVENDDNLPF